jgi:hypothetical protein
LWSACLERAFHAQGQRCSVPAFEFAVPCLTIFAVRLILATIRFQSKKENFCYRQRRRRRKKLIKSTDKHFGLSKTISGANVCKVRLHRPYQACRRRPGRCPAAHHPQHRGKPCMEGKLSMEESEVRLSGASSLGWAGILRQEYTQHSPCANLWAVTLTYSTLGPSTMGLLLSMP